MGNKPLVAVNYTLIANTSYFSPNR